jgi:hypothetical protein
MEKNKIERTWPFWKQIFGCNFKIFGTTSVNHHKTIIKTLQTDKQQETSTSKTRRHVTYMCLRLFIHHNVVALERKHERE